jgi:DNA-binding NarL/FixJ family response regulator
LLEAESDFAIVGEANNGLEAVRLVERLHPMVVVLDLRMPGLSGLEALRIVKQRSPQTHVVILSMYSEEAFVIEALTHGAVGYVLKGCNPAHLVEAVRRAAAGQHYLSPALSEHAIQPYLEKTAAPPLHPHETLTPREREVLQLAAEGKANTEIGALLFISPRTVEMHRSHLMRKLGLRTHTDLIRYALKRGIIPADA